MQQKYQIEQLQTYQPNQTTPNNQYINTSLDSSANHSQVLDDLMADTSSLHKTRYGNIRVLYQNSRFLFTIGPDCTFFIIWQDFCFIIAYIMFTIMSFTIIYTVSTQIQNLCLNIITIVYSVMQNLSYLAIALSNPGIQTSDTIPTEEEVNDNQIKRFCKRCGIRMQKGTHHCRDCDVCIRDYDHHCPWTSKCIGEKNLCKFYVFVTLTLTYIVYCMIVLLICSASSALEINSKLSGKTL